MPLFQSTKLSTFEKAKAYAVANKLNYYAAYHLLLWAKEQDGTPVGKVHPDMPALSAMDSGVQAAVAAAKAAVSA